MALNLQNEEDLPSTFTQDSGDDEQHDIVSCYNDVV